MVSDPTVSSASPSMDSVLSASSTGSSSGSGIGVGGGVVLSGLWSSLPEVVRNDKLLTEGNGNSSGSTVASSQQPQLAATSVKTEQLAFSGSSCNGSLGQAAGSDGDSLPESPMSVNDGECFIFISVMP